MRGKVEFQAKDLPPLPPYDDWPIWYLMAGPVSPGPRLKKDTSADVLIIGGGFTGLSCAYHLKKRYPELEVLLLEAYLVGSGASGRNGGLMLNGPSSHGLLEPEAEALFYKKTMDCIGLILKTIERHSLKVSFSLNGTISLLTTKRSAEEAHRYVEMMQAFGIPLHFLDGSKANQISGVEGIEGAVLDPYSGHINGLQYLLGLKGLLLEMGVRIYEQSPVKGLMEGKRCLAITPRARVQAKSVILATNAFTPYLGYFRRELLCIVHHVSASWGAGASLRGNLPLGISGFDDDRTPISYGTFLPEGHLLFGGGSTLCVDYSMHNRVLQGPFISSKKIRALRRANEMSLHAYFPWARCVGLDLIWSGAIALTRDGLPLIGVTGRDKNIYYALGYCGHGVTLSNLAGIIIADIFGGDPKEWGPFLSKTRPCKRYPPEPIRYLGFKAFWSLLKRLPFMGKGHGLRPGMKGRQGSYEQGH